MYSKASWHPKKCQQQILSKQIQKGRPKKRQKQLVIWLEISLLTKLERVLGRIKSNLMRPQKSEKHHTGRKNRTNIHTTRKKATSYWWTLIIIAINIEREDSTSKFAEQHNNSYSLKISMYLGLGFMMM